MDKSSKSANKIGIFDSGVGGLTVMRAIQNLLPNEEILYYADTEHLPYGDKSQEEIIRFLTDALDFFCSRGIKLLVVACHTACAVGLDFLRSTSPIPIIAILEQGIELLIEQTSQSTLAILATQTTVSSGVYQHKIQAAFPQTKLISIACPQFVPLIEEGFLSHPLTQLAIHKTLKPLKEEPVDAILLACTHYPLLKAAFEQELGSQVPLLDPSAKCAQATYDWLKARHLLKHADSIPEHHFYVTANPEKFEKMSGRFLEKAIKPLQVQMGLL